MKTLKIIIFNIYMQLGGHVQQTESMKFYILHLIMVAIVENLSFPGLVLIRHNTDLKTKN